MRRMKTRRSVTGYGRVSVRPPKLYRNGVQITDLSAPITWLNGDILTQEGDGVAVMTGAWQGTGAVSITSLWPAPTAPADASANATLNTWTRIAAVPAGSIKTFQPMMWQTAGGFAVGWCGVYDSNGVAVTNGFVAGQNYYASAFSTYQKAVKFEVKYEDGGFWIRCLDTRYAAQGAIPSDATWGGWTNDSNGLYLNAFRSFTTQSYTSGQPNIKQMGGISDTLTLNVMAGTLDLIYSASAFGAYTINRSAGAQVKMRATPLDFTTVEAWYRKRLDTDCTLSAGALTLWKDLAGKGHDLSQSTQASMPTLDAKGWPKFGGGGVSQLTMSAVTPAVASAMTFVGVFNAPPSTSTVLTAVSGTSIQMRLRQFPSTGKFGVARSASPATDWVSSVVTPSTDFVFAATKAMSSAVISMSANGAAVGSVTAVDMPIELNKIGGQDSGSFTTPEMLLISSVVDDATKSRLEGYLAWAWGCDQYLPGGHTYKASPPAKSFTDAGVFVTGGNIAPPSEGLYRNSIFIGDPTAALPLTAGDSIAQLGTPTVSVGAWQGTGAVSVTVASIKFTALPDPALTLNVLSGTVDTQGLGFVDATIALSAGAIWLKDTVLRKDGAAITNLAAGISTGGTFTQQGSPITLPAILSGSAYTYNLGAGNRLTLSGANTHAGGNTVSAGTLTLGHASALGATTGAGVNTIAAGAVLDINGFSPTMYGPAGPGTLKNGSATASTTVLKLNGTQTFSGPIDCTGTTQIQLSGAGQLTLTNPAISGVSGFVGVAPSGWSGSLRFNFPANAGVSVGNLCVTVGSGSNGGASSSFVFVGNDCQFAKTTRISSGQARAYGYMSDLRLNGTTQAFQAWCNDFANGVKYGGNRGRLQNGHATLPATVELGETATKDESDQGGSFKSVENGGAAVLHITKKGLYKQTLYTDTTFTSTGTLRIESGTWASPRGSTNAIQILVAGSAPASTSGSANSGRWDISTNAPAWGGATVNIVTTPTATFAAYTFLTWAGTATGTINIQCNGVAVTVGTPFVANGRTMVVQQSGSSYTLACTA